MFSDTTMVVIGLLIFLAAFIALFMRTMIASRFGDNYEQLANIALSEDREVKDGGQ